MTVFAVPRTDQRAHVLGKQIVGNRLCAHKNLSLFCTSYKGESGPPLTAKTARIGMVQ